MSQAPIIEEQGTSLPWPVVRGMLSAERLAGGLWWEQTWNAWTGCSHASPGCAHCYAERLATTRLAHQPQYRPVIDVTDKANRRWNGQVRRVEGAMEKPLHWRKPRLVFVNDMSDTFHERIDVEDHLALLFLVMSLKPDITFQILTKRADRMAELWGEDDEGSDSPLAIAVANEFVRTMAGCGEWNLDDYPPEAQRKMHYWNSVCGEPPWPLPNVWVGVTCCNQAEFDEKVPLLLKCPAAVRFASLEPMLGPVDVSAGVGPYCCHECEYVGQSAAEWRCPTCWKDYTETGANDSCPHCGKEGDFLLLCPQCGASEASGFGLLADCDLHTGLDWVICGGESGPGARPMAPGWVRGVRDPCVEAGVPFFFKQWGGHRLVAWGDGRPGDMVLSSGGTVPWTQPLRIPGDAGSVIMRPVGKKVAGRVLDGRVWNEFPKATANE